MKIKSHIRSVQLIFSIFIFLIFTGLTGCKDDGTEFLEKELVQKESEETSGTDVEQEDPKDTESGESAEKSSKDGTDIKQETQQKSDVSGDISSETIYVDICGAVTSPGVYELPYGSRVFQAIEKAGGYLPEAAASYLNRAKGLSDGQQIYVPTQEEVDSQMVSVTEDDPEATSETGSGNNNGQGTAGKETGTAGNGTASGTDQKINLNTADVSQLTTLTGVGESKALAIIAYREENGPFTSVEDIMNVPGIKEGTYEKIKDKIAIE